MTPYARRTGLDPRNRAVQPAWILRTAAAGVLLSLLRWHELARQRRQLLAMDDRMLRDIGITRADAHHEGRRRFWDDQGIEWQPWR